MRDLKRIKKTLRIIGKIWKRNPDLRLMQLLINTYANYNTEDDALISMLDFTYTLKHGKGDKNATV